MYYSTEERESLYLKHLPQAAALDMEISSLSELSTAIESAKDKGKFIVGSFHDFEGVPEWPELRATLLLARAQGVDCVKVAAMTRNRDELRQLAGIALRLSASGPFAAMGMGALGRASRLAFATMGSALNYGWLGQPQVDGQWQAEDFARLLADIGAR